MSLASGLRLGPYEILAPLGAGGMGEVYKARDTRLDRIVAVKVLPDAAGALPEVRQRFEREARAVSALNHPHICSLFDIGQQDSIDYLVMEYLEGETLAERIRKGPLPIEQALRFGVEIAGALDAAHRQGIIHRDLKPANIILTASGPKVLDFGLAKIQQQQQRAAFVSGGSVLQTLTTPLTGTGTIVGTLQYMAPEQLEGHDADARTDLFAFGAVLYEMITGRRAFEATSHAALISSIMMAEPAPLSTVQPLASPALDHVVRTCLAKSPAERWQSAHDLLVQLKWIASAGSQAGVAAPLVAQRRSRQRLSWILAAVLSLALLSSLAMLFSRPKPPEPALMRFHAYPPPGLSYAPLDVPAISPDGRRLAFVGSLKGGKPVLWVRSLDSLNAQPVPGTDDATHPFWSPDSRFVAFFAEKKLKKLDVHGAPAQTICVVQGTAFGGTWNRDETILFAQAGQPLHRVPASGGEPKPALPVDRAGSEIFHGFPSFLPDGRHFIYYSLKQEFDRNEVRVGSLDSTETKVILRSRSRAAYSPPGLLVFARQQTLMAQPFDTRKLELTGEPTPLAEGVGTVYGSTGTQSSVSETGVLVWRAGGIGATQIGAYSREGKRSSGLVTMHPAAQMMLSPDEKRLAVEAVDSKTGNRDIWLLELATGISSRVTTNPARDLDPVWSPDGRELMFARADGRRTNLYRKTLGGRPEELFLDSAQLKYTAQWLRDGSILFLDTDGKSFSRVPLEGERKPSILFQSEFEKDQPVVSPDGRWIAYNSLESGRWEVYMASFPAFTERRQISNAGGCQPLWRKDGRELFYLSLESKLMSVDLKPGAVPEPELPRELFSVALTVDPIRNQYAVTGDGRKFLVLESADQAAVPMTVVVNWTAGLAR